MKVQQAKISEVKRYSRNPRNNEGAIEKCMASISEFGWRQPIVVDSNMVIIVGDTRYQSAERLGEEYVPIHVADGLTPEQVKAYRLADNRVGEEADWDNSLLVLELGDLSAAGVDLSLTGFDEDELSDLLELDEEPGPGEGNGEGGDDDEAAVSVGGDVWLLGKHHIKCGRGSEIDVDRLVRTWQEWTGRDAELKSTGQTFDQVSRDRIAVR